MNAELIQQIAGEVRERFVEICKQASHIGILRSMEATYKAAMARELEESIRSLSLDDIVAKYSALSQEKANG